MTNTEANSHIYSKQQLVDIFDACLDKTLGEVDRNNVFDRAKTMPKITGIAGDVIEQSVLNYRPNPEQLPDLTVDGIDTELKTTGIKISKGGDCEYEAKEPMSITAVSPHKIVFETFYDSNFWHKLEHMLIVYYLYTANHPVPAIEYQHFPIKGYEFHEFDEDDKKILQNDWEIVRNFIDTLQKNYDVPEEQYPRLSSELRSQLLMIDTAKTGFKYTFSEGPIAFPDPWDRPSRTMLTSESTLNRSTHVVKDKQTGKLRLITPIEAEHLQGFDDDWTNSGMPMRMRYFCMGNALVVSMITRMGKTLDNIFDKE